MSDEPTEKQEKTQDQAAGLRELFEELPQVQDQAAATLLQTNPAGHAEEDTATEQLSIGELNRMIEELCISKAEEYHLLGYKQVTAEEIWKCVSSKYKREYPALHVLVNDILSLKPDKFMNWLLIQAYKS